MTIEGHVENGQIVLHGGVQLPEGISVRVELLASEADAANAGPSASAPLPSLYDRLKPVIGKATGLPADLAINHDHYLHGQPKRQ